MAKSITRVVLTFLVFLMGNWKVSSAAGKWVDLTHKLNENMPLFPAKTHIPFHITDRIISEIPQWFAVNHFKTSEHTGTHMDAPYHFNPNKMFIHQIPVSHFVAPAVVVDITDRAAKQQDAPLLLEDLLAWERENGQVPDGAIILAYTGWDKYWNDTEKFLGNTKDDPSGIHYPGFSTESVEWLLKNRNIVGVGIDTISFDVGSDITFPVHKMTSEANMYGLENLANLGLLPASGAVVYSFPLKIEGGTGSPVRVVANIPNSPEKLTKGLLGILASFTQHF